MDSEVRADIAGTEAPEQVGAQERMEQLLRELEPLARSLARRWANGAPDAVDDLAQIAWVAIWQMLEEHPDAPRSHLARRAAGRILNERRRGTSVDRRLNPARGRSKAWAVESLEDAGDALDRSHPGRHDPWSSPTEEDAVGRLFYQELRRTLSPKEDIYLSLLLMGFQHRDIGRLLELNGRQVSYFQGALRRKTLALLDGHAPFQLHQQEASRTRRVKRPFRVPKDIQALLEWLAEADE